MTERRSRKAVGGPKGGARPPRRLDMPDPKAVKAKLRRELDFRDGDFDRVPVQLLFDWLQRGVITTPLYREGNAFHNLVISAHSPDISAMPLVKVRVDTSVRASFSMPHVTNAAALAAIERAIRAVGGPDSGTGSALYHVIGLEWPIRRWCEAVGLGKGGNERRFAAGMLVAGLEVLSATRWSS